MISLSINLVEGAVRTPDVTNREISVSILQLDGPHRLSNKIDSIYGPIDPCKFKLNEQL